MERFYLRKINDNTREDVWTAFDKGIKVCKSYEGIVYTQIEGIDIE